MHRRNSAGLLRQIDYATRELSKCVSACKRLGWDERKQYYRVRELRRRIRLLSKVLHRAIITGSLSDHPPRNDS